MPDTDDQTPEGPRDLIAPYVFDHVDDLERRQVERLVAADPDARRELDEFREVVAAFTVDTAPPASMRSQVLASITQPAAAPVRLAEKRHKQSAAGRPSAARRRWVTLGVAAAVAAGIALPTSIAVQSHSQQQQLQAEADVVAQMVADPTSRVLRAEVEGGGEVSALVSADRVFLSTSEMADADADSDYQLWVIDGEQISSLGLMRPEDGSTSALVEAGSGSTLAVTVEPRGGSEQPTTDPIVAVEI